jgi:hypothetical protein
MFVKENSIMRRCAYGHERVHLFLDVVFEGIVPGDIVSLEVPKVAGLALFEPFLQRFAFEVFPS